ncbi:hypothetical protein CP978_18470 [Streptomyces nodosus]|uniref:Uncharacterized protein n=1 Tax=Streptomyces nodosus TaxID=40318 RepID=A0A5P2W7G7_9ACTN|nr:hypothetical protein CP978_18470 [Streptomyces nodosus]
MRGEERRGGRGRGRGGGGGRGEGNGGAAGVRGRPGGARATARQEHHRHGGNGAHSASGRAPAGEPRRCCRPCAVTVRRVGHRPASFRQDRMRTPLHPA